MSTTAPDPLNPENQSSPKNLDPETMTSADETDWHHADETVRLLELAVAQIDVAMKEGDNSVNHLSENFIQLAKNMKEIQSELGESPVAAKLLNLEGNVQEAIVAFQFYDRITQRLDHVCRHLEDLSQIIKTAETRHSPETWQALQKKICDSYTMEAERIMFQHILMGHSVEEALEIYHHAFKNEDKGIKGPDDEVEFF